MTNENWERIWKEAAMDYSRHYHGICREKLEKTTKSLNQDICCFGQDSNGVTLTQYSDQLFGALSIVLFCI
jgi:hypothetical protein